MDSRAVGRLVIGIGAAMIVVGLLIMTGALSWFGRLPGDVRIERDGVHVYVPITSMLLVSIAVTLISWILRRFL
jgi:hypothetical protein